jgi:hypothetical protein
MCRRHYPLLSLSLSAYIDTLHLQDAQEFLCECLDVLEDELATFIKPVTGTNATDSIESWSLPSLCNFTSEVKQMMSCLSCQETDVVTQRFRDFSIELADDDDDDNNSNNGTYDYEYEQHQQHLNQQTIDHQGKELETTSSTSLLGDDDDAVVILPATSNTTTAGVSPSSSSSTQPTNKLNHNREPKKRNIAELFEKAFQVC